MTFNDDADISKGRASRRAGAGLALGGGGLGIVGIIVLIVSLTTGVDLGPALGGLDGGSQAGGDQGIDSALDQCQTGADANRDLDCRMKGAAASLEDYWSGQVQGYRGTAVQLFSGSVNTGCGGASSAVGPFYCPADEIVYIDTAFFDELRDRFGSSGGPLAQLYVVAHEWGHHIQNITGQMQGLDTSRTGPDSDGVRLELQADCYAGAWVGAQESTLDDNGVPFLEPITAAELADALSAAAAVGDDHIQESVQGQVNPETWTHGASAQRQTWFQAGRTGGPGSCDTFSIPGSRL
ncbi:KPN_02809 family neutral zinc metallopeptidase [Protaetiibacter larvae]|uniref:Neutral zinc metallopeptidase n=1 Tax=Protaetiibacter larvae TaxID=2592654 RepID=A0A5C1Y7K4_9MICO|nr:neutral zinc metallopeptidase [Protaetiibacter larvae]QEO09165.1 neutral zinc metallopeptidase [Protaetiibacter larvae]